MPVMLSFWGKEENKSAVTEVMARRGYKLNSSGATGTNTKSAVVLTCFFFKKKFACIYMIYIVTLKVVLIFFILFILF